MKLQEFKSQDKWCRENNLPDGIGCDGCPCAENSRGYVCADALRNLADKFIKAIGKSDELDTISKKLKNDFGMSPYAQLALVEGVIELRP